MPKNVVASPLLKMSLDPSERGSEEAQTIVIVNGSAGMLETIEPVLEAGHYDIVFVESSDYAYSQIKRVQPDLVILCVRIDDIDGFQVLSMLKLDESTREIPVLTYAMETDGEDAEDDAEGVSDSQLFAARPVVPRMN